MKFGPVAKIDKRNTSTSNKFHDDFMLIDCNVIVLFLVYGKFAGIQRSDSRGMVYKTYIFISGNL